MRPGRRIFALLTLGVMVYLFQPLVGELRAAEDLFCRAHWLWLPAVLAVELVSYSFLTWLNRLALSPFPGTIRFRRLAMLLTSMAFIEVAVPSAGTSGVALRARLLGHHGYSFEASSFTLFIETVALLLAMTSLALVGVAHLVGTGDISRAQTGVLACLVVAAAALATAAWLTINSEQRGRRLIAGLVPRWNRLFGRFRRLETEPLEARLERFHVGLAEFHLVPKWKFVLAAYGRVGLDVAVLGGCFLLFGHAVPLGELLTGYAMLILIGPLSALPGGLALPDVGLLRVFTSLGVPAAQALAGGLLYRLIAVWLVRFTGFINWQVLEERR